MVTSQRLSQGFHRLAILLAAIPLLIAVFLVFGAFLNASNLHENLLCAQNVLNTDSDQVWKRVFDPNSSDGKVALAEIGCSTNQWQRVSVDEIKNATWLSAFASASLPGAPIALILAMAIYLLFRAIGWVIGGGSIEIE